MRNILTGILLSGAFLLSGSSGFAQAPSTDSTNYISLSTQISTLRAAMSAMNEKLQRVTACQEKGMFYGGSHPRSDANGCIPDLSIDEEGTVRVQDDIYIGDEAYAKRFFYK